VETPLSRRLLAGEFREGDTIVVDVADGELTFRRKVVTEAATENDT